MQDIDLLSFFQLVGTLLISPPSLPHLQESIHTHIDGRNRCLPGYQAGLFILSIHFDVFDKISLTKSWMPICGDDLKKPLFKSHL